MFDLLGIVLIDDEVLVRVGLKSLIDWDKYGYQIIGEANNGEEGLRLIEEKKPDIVITDIKMPIKDGLEMIEETKEKNMDHKFVVLSSFDEFHLVKKAMKLGAVDYLIKLELDKELLLETLSPLKEMIIQEKEKVRNEKIIKHNINNKENMKKEFFKKIIGKLIDDEEEIRLISQELDIKLNKENLVCMAVQINNNDSFNKFDRGDMQLFEFSIINIVEEIVNDFFKAYAFMNNWGEIVVIFSYNHSMEKDEYLKKTDEMAVILSKMLKQYFSVSVSIAISNTQNGFNSINTAYLECCQGLEYSFYCQPGEAVHYKDIKDYQNELDKGIELISFDKELTEFLELMDTQDLDKLFTTLVDKVRIKNISRNRAYDLCFQIIYLVKTKLKGGIAGEILDSDENFYKCIDTLNNVTELVDWLKCIKNRLISVISKHKEDEKSFIIAQAQKYIKKFFREEFTLTDLAEKLNVSAGYLSTLFKEIVGISFIEYITKLRIEEAKNLLGGSNVKIYEVSEMVGYNNPYYFSRVFKKSTGKTPSEYRLKKY